MKKAGMSPEQILQLVGEVRPAHVHLLGLGYQRAPAKQLVRRLLTTGLAELIELVMRFGAAPSRLGDVLKLGSASSQALTLLNTMLTLDTVAHLAEVEAEDMQIFANAMSERHLTADTVTARGLAGANELTALLHRLNP